MSGWSIRRSARWRSFACGTPSSSWSPPGRGTRASGRSRSSNSRSTWAPCGSEARPPPIRGELHPAGGDPDRLAKLGVVHVVQQHHLGAAVDRLPELVQGVDLDLDLHQPRGVRAGALQRGADGSAHRRQVVVLDQHAVGEAEAVVLGPAHSDRLLVQLAHPGAGLARVQDARPRPLHCLHRLAGQGGDAAGPLCHHRSLREGGPVERLEGNHCLRVRPLEHASERGAAGQDQGAPWPPAPRGPAPPPAPAPAWPRPPPRPAPRPGRGRSAGRDDPPAHFFREGFFARAPAFAFTFRSRSFWTTSAGALSRKLELPAYAPARPDPHPPPSPPNSSCRPHVPGAPNIPYAGQVPRRAWRGLPSTPGIRSGRALTAPYHPPLRPAGASLPLMQYARFGAHHLRPPETTRRQHASVGLEGAALVRLFLGERTSRHILDALVHGTGADRSPGVRVCRRVAAQGGRGLWNRLPRCVGARTLGDGDAIQ